MSGPGSPGGSGPQGPVVVTGPAGFIGTALVRCLVERGVEVHALRGVDLREPGALEGRVPRGADVVHLAARAGGIGFQEADHAAVFRENTAITRAVLAAAAGAPARRVFLASSAVVYAADAPEEIPETGPLVRPAQATGYAWSKLTDEAAAAWTRGCEVVVGRFANVYGPGGPASTVVHGLIRRAVSERASGRLTVWGDGSAVRSFLYVDDAARAVLAVLERGAAGGVYNLDASEPVAIRDLAALVRDAVDPGLALSFDATRPSGPARRVLDTARLRALGWQPQVDLSTGIAATAAAHPPP